MALIGSGVECHFSMIVPIKLVIIFKKMRKVGIMQFITNVLISHYKYK